VRGQTPALRKAVAEVLEEDLEEATNQQLYDRTRLKVSFKMLRSIGSKIIGDVVEVGYNMNQSVKIKYARRRLNLKGISPTGRHLLDMKPSEYLRKVSNPKIAALVRKAKQGMLGAGE